MNAGSYQNVISKILRDVDYIGKDGAIHTISAKELGFSYRSSAFRRGEVDGVIVSASFHLEHADQDKLLQRVAEVTQHRNTFQEKKNTNLGTLSCTPTFYREIILANPFFGFTCGVLILAQRGFFRLREKLIGVPFPAKRTLEIKLIKWWFKYPLARQVHSDYSLNCFISTYAKPSDFEVYTEWLFEISKGRIKLENEYVKGTSTHIY